MSSNVAAFVRRSEADVERAAAVPQDEVPFYLGRAQVYATLAVAVAVSGIDVPQVDLSGVEDTLAQIRRLT